MTTPTTADVIRAMQTGWTAERSAHIAHQEAIARVMREAAEKVGPCECSNCREAK